MPLINRTTADKVMEASDKKCLRKTGYSYRASSYHKLGLKYGVVDKVGGGYTTYKFGDGSKMRVGSAGTDELY